MYITVSHVLSRLGVEALSEITICLHGQKALPLLSVHFQEKSAPTKIWVAHSRGLPRSTNSVSTIASSLWHFQGYSSIGFPLALFPAVIPFLGAAAYCFAAHEHYRHRSLCEHGLSSQL